MSLSTSDAARIIDLPAVEIAAQVRSGGLAAIDVTEAYLERIERLNPQIKAICFRTDDEARRTARQIDEARTRGERLGPLAGVPTSIKDCFDLLGTPTTLGIGSRRHCVPTEEGPVVRRLRAAGAVFVGKTNVPQIMLSYETVSSLGGRTTHPERADRSCGGSSGGEAAAVGARFSAVGLGSDLLGSIRQPAHVCGIHGFKPTTQRCSMRGVGTVLLGMEALVSQPGPLARHVADVEAFMNVLVDGDDDCDPYCMPVPWRSPDEVDIAKLRIGVWEEDPMFVPSPAIRRAVREAADELSRAGAEVVPFALPESERAWRLSLAVLAASGGAGARRMLAGESPIPMVARALRVWGMSPAVRAVVTAMAERMGQPWQAKLIRICRNTSAAGYWELVRDRKEYVRDTASLLAKHRIDAVIAPPHGLPALLHGTSSETLTAGVFSFVPNLLGLPCATLSATRVRPGEESVRPKTRELSQSTAWRVEQGSTGLPVGVQIASLWWREDVCFALMRRLEAYFKTREDYPLHRRPE
jgi:Asp-tRNA(Asn)/Glu-tRNA(Gln) amidotransferase A subunit family amidase